MKFAKTKLTGQLGMNHVEEIALRAGCKLIPIPEGLDTGIDGFIEFAENEEALGKVVAFQVKRGPSFFANGSPRTQTDARHLRYWRDYCLPVLLIVVHEDGDESYWMDIQQHLRNHPGIIESGPYVLHPPKTQRFTVETLKTVILPGYARRVDFGDAVSWICDEDLERRVSAIGLMYRFHNERRAAFALMSALCFETDPEMVTALCDVYSRYLSHPEARFDVTTSLRSYAAGLLDGLGEVQLLRILGSFESNKFSFDVATEIFHISADEIWVRDDIIERGSAQQGMAVIVQSLAGGNRLRGIFANRKTTPAARRAAVAMFGYLNYSCNVSDLDEVMREEADKVLVALLTWLRFWVVEEEGDQDLER